MATDLSAPAQAVTNQQQQQQKKKKKEKVVRQKRSDGLYPCIHFDKNGSCTFGDSCKFSHLGPTDPGLPDGAQQPRKKRKRNGICLKFAEHGECDFGDNCRYKHADVNEQASRDALLIATALGNKDDAQEEKLRRIMALPEHLKVKARAVFFAKQRKGDFRVTPGAAQHTPPSNACFSFQKGNCTHGDQCRFSHGQAAPTNNGAVTEAASPAQAQDPDAVPTKRTKIRFDDDDSAQLQESAPKQQRQPAPTNGADKRVCFSFQVGKCRRGAACKFAHISDPSAKEAAQQHGSEDKPCFAFLKGNCTRGDSCFFAHDRSLKVNEAQARAADTKRKLCRWWAKGNCTRGTDCIFAHGQAKKITFE